MNDPLSFRSIIVTQASFAPSHRCVRLSLRSRSRHSALPSSPTLRPPRATSGPSASYFLTTPVPLTETTVLHFSKGDSADFVPSLLAA